MANLKYFADLSNGETVEFTKVWNRNQSSKHTDTVGWNGQEWIKVNRVIERKSNPSRHECDARCLNATGLVMKCECSCNGKNHGKGSIVCEAA